MISLELGAGECKTVSIQDILYLKSNAHLVDYYLVSGDVIHVRELINEVEKRLDEYGFARVHRQYIVNIQSAEAKHFSLSKNFPPQRTNTSTWEKYKDSVTLKYTERMRNIL